jgi:hypothetical protein
MGGTDPIQAIRLRAYEIWENEGRPLGREHDHWLRAETELSLAPEPQPVKPKSAPVKPKRKTKTAALPAQTIAAKNDTAKGNANREKSRRPKQ